MSNRTAFLDMIAYSELGLAVIKGSDNGYDVLVGSTPTHIMTFLSYEDHPRILNTKLNSTAAGRYQILERYYDAYKGQLNLPDFSPVSQDAIALQMIRECKALDFVDSGAFAVAVGRCKSRWASRPSAGFGQPEHSLAVLQAAYVAAGGLVAG